MSIHIQELKTALEGALSCFKEEVAGIRGSRPSPALVEDILVEYYGQKTPIKQLGSISVVPPREIQISAWDMNAVKAIEKAIEEQVNRLPSSEGTTIHVNLPSLTQERRDELIKMIKVKAEEARIKSRTVRDDVKKTIDAQEKFGALTEDDKFRALDSMQKEMDAFNKSVDEAVEKKTKEINE